MNGFGISYTEQTKRPEGASTQLIEGNLTLRSKSVENEYHVLHERDNSRRQCYLGLYYDTMTTHPGSDKFARMRALLRSGSTRLDQARLSKIVKSPPKTLSIARSGPQA